MTMTCLISWEQIENRRLTIRFCFIFLLSSDLARSFHSKKRGGLDQGYRVYPAAPAAERIWAARKEHSMKHVENSKQASVLRASLAALLLIGCASSGKGNDLPSEETDSDTETVGDGTLPDILREGTKEVLLLDDFEDGDADNETGGFWMTYDDRNDHGESAVWPPSYVDGKFVSDAPGYGDLGRAAHIKGTTGDILGFDYLALMTNLGADAFCPLAVPTDIDLNAFDGIQFMAKGKISGGRLVFKIFHMKDGEEDNCENGYPDTLTEFVDYQVEFQKKLETAWSLIRIPFADLAQGDWATIWVDLEEVLAHAKNFTWQFEASGADIDLWLDYVSLYKSELFNDTDQAPDMEIHAPEPPEDAVIESIDIDNSLQSLAEAGLNKGCNINLWLEQDRFEDFGEYDEAFVARLAAAGYKALRLPIDLDQYIEARASYFDGDADFAVDRALFTVLDSFDTWTRAHGLSLTIDYHQYDSSMKLQDAKAVETAVLLWSAVAEHFKDNPREDLFFELLNEPEQSGGAVSSLSPDEWTSVAEALIDAIRAYDSNRVIIFGDTNWYGISPLTSRTPFEDPKVIYAFHFYEPFVFTSQGTDWAKTLKVHDVPYPYSEERWSAYFEDFGFDPEVQPSWYMDRVESYYKEANKSALRNAIVRAKQWAVLNQVPIICNEFGAFERNSSKEDRIDYYTDMIDIFEELKIPWQHWFQIMDKQTGSVDPELMDAFGLT